MLQELELNNFLSYEKEKIKFTPNSTIAVVGENGHGKSGLLESILFCLYGEGREDLSKLVRIGSDGTMSVRLTMANVPAKAKKLVVERGVKKSGAGYTKVMLDDVLIAQGGASQKNNKAQEYIDAALGVDKESFLLTSFFGLGANDSLMQVAPAARLETLQKLAGVDICIEFNKTANDYAKAISQTMNETKAAIAAINSVTENVTELEFELKERSSELKKCKTKLDALQKERSELAKDETRYQSLVQELEATRGKREGKLSLKEKASKAVLTAKNNKLTAKEEAASLVKERESLEDKLSKYSAIDVIRKQYDTLQKEIIESEASKALLASALKIENASTCPLCGADLSKSKCADWSKQHDALTEKIAKLRETLLSKKAEGEARASFDKKLERVKEAMKNSADDVRESEEALADAEKELGVVSAALDTLDTRITAIKGELKDYNSLVQKINDADATINKLLGTKGSLEQAVKNHRERIDRCAENVSKVKTLLAENESNMEKMTAYKIVADAFSRYAIPVQLLRNIRVAIQRRATKIYQYFNSGVIRIDDVEGARPGVEFVLYDEMGARSYKSLSAGEKVMVFLAVRVAITQIINASRNNKVEFLILDEIAGNLSVKRRDALTKLINTLLRKFFTQVFMVSHVDLRDIFNETILVEKVNGVSRAEIV